MHGCCYVGLLRLESVDAPRTTFDKAIGSRASVRFVVKRHYPNRVQLDLSLPNSGTIVPLIMSVRKSQFYRLKTGITFSHSGVVYRESDYSIVTALPRLMAFDRDYYKIERGVVVPDILTEFDVIDRQDVFSRTRVWRRFLKNFTADFDTYYDTHFCDWFDKQFDYPNIPHPKRRLRVAAKDDIERRLGWLHLNSSKITSKLKTGEWAKFNKKARNICDIGVEGSLVAGVCCEFLKKFMTSFVYRGDGVCSFHGSPERSDLRNMFSDLWNPRRRVNLHYFSDDSCLSVICTDGVYRCNMDVASADSSHYQPIFDALIETVENKNYYTNCMRRCIQQLTQVLHVKDCLGRTISKVKPEMPVLYSGSTLTTLVNNFSQLFMFAKLSRLPRNLTVAEAEKLIPVYMSQIGYSVTVQKVERIEDFQFLKFSCGSDYEPFINLGPFIRMLGWSKRDIPRAVPGGRRDTLKVRSEKFEYSKILGYRGMGRSSLYDLLAAKYNHYSGVQSRLDRFHVIDGCSRVPDSVVMARYRLTHVEWYGLLDTVNDLSLNEFRYHHIRHSAIDKIMEVDYGYGRPLTHDV